MPELASCAARGGIAVMAASEINITIEVGVLMRALGYYRRSDIGTWQIR